MRQRPKRLALFALLAGLLVPLGASAVTPPTVLSATPGLDGRAIARFTLNFSEPMTPLGAQRPAPIAMKCEVDGSGRWVDASTYVWEYEKPLPGGAVCKAELKPALKTLAGRALTGTRQFTIDAGGPYVLDLLPNDGDEGIEEDQAFILAPNGLVDRASVAAGAYCAVEGIGERIAVDLIPAATVERVVMALSDYRRDRLLEAVAANGEAPDDSAAQKAEAAKLIGLKCRRPLPPGHDVALVWAASIRSPSGRIAGADQRFDYTVRKEFSARLSCGRVNPQAGCDPVEAIKVEFSAPVPRAQALAVRLEAGGRVIAPVDEDANEQTLSTVRFKPPLPPGVKGRLVMPARLLDETGRPLANARRFPLEFAIDEPPPLVKFAAPFGILEARQGGVLPVTVRGVEPALAQSVKAISADTVRVGGDDAAIAGWIRKVQAAQREDYREEGAGKAKRLVNHTGDRPLLGARAPGPVRRLQLALPGKGRDFEVVGLPLSSPGFYLVELASPTLGRALMGRPATRYVSAAALVTDMAVHFKWGRAGSLVWVTGLDSGAPVAGAAIRITDTCTGRQLAAGTTDRDGRLMVTSGLPEPSTADECRQTSPEAPLMVSARIGGDFSFVLTNWNQGIGPYDFNLNYGMPATEPIFHTILDRTLLRAGETVHMKHVYRAQTPTGFRTGGALKGTLILQHRGSDTAYELPLAVGADGIGESEWKAPADAPGGDYDIQVKTEAGMRYTHQSFRVDEYRLPTMRASLTGPKARLARPRRLPLDLYLAYLSGGGAGSAPVKLRTEYEPLNDRPDGWDEWTFGGSAVREGTTPLDDEGEDSGGSDQVPASATLPLTLGKDGALRTEIDLPEIQDAMRARIEMDYEDANGETLTTGTSVPLYASAIRLGIRPDGWIQRSGNLQLKVVALDLDGRIVAGQPVEVQLFTREILSARRRLIGGFYAYDNNARVTKLAANCSGVTDAKGIVECTLEPGVSGEVLAMAITRDRDGNEARAVTSVYLTGDGDWWFGGDNGDRMDVIPEAPSYRSGETARFQVRMPFREATALVTVEREGVLSSFVTTLSGKDPVVEVKMDGSYAPDVFVSVLAVRGRVAGWKLWLTEFARKWHLPFAGDPSQPTALVDLAKPAFRLGFAQVKVGWEAHRLDVKVTPARETWRVRENAEVEVQVTGPGGVAPADAEIAFAAVDEALLALAPNDSWDLLEAMMEERPLSVLTSTAQMQVVGKRHYGRKALAAGGGGGGDLSSLARSDFRPLLLWRGRVPLDANGRATVSVPLADSLSSYKLVAIATAGEQGFGTGSATIRTVQDLGVYSGVPPLVRSGDQFDALLTLRNSTAEDLKVIATAEVSPALGALKPQIVTVPAGGATPVSWRVTAPEAASLRWTVTASAAKSAASDRVTVEQEIVPPVPEETWAASFLRLSPGLRVPLAPPAGALPGRGAIEVALTASPAPSLSGVADYMRAYPYGCFEQRLSKAIALEDADAWAKQMADLPAYLADNGLLRYWPGSRQPGSVALTAYALSITAEAGLPWPAEAKGKLLDALRSVADGRLTDEGEAPADQRLLRLAAVAALARNGEASAAMAARVAMPLRDMPTASLADWLAILDRTKGIGPAPKAAAEAALRGRIVYEGTRLDLVDKANAPWWMMVSGDEMALKALIAVTGRPGWAQEAPRMMIGTALRQSRGHWDTTPANAWGTLAVRRFAAAYPGVPTGVTTVTLGGSSVERGWPAPAPIRFPLPAQQASLIFAHPGAAQPWAFVSVKAAVPLTAASFSGYRIAREASFLVRKTPGAVSRGDVMKIRITVQAPVDRTWVVVVDPIPAGASIVSGGGQSSLLAEKAGGGEGGWPSYIERSHGVWRAYYGWLPSGRTSVEYVVRINTTGRFQLPPTHVEAMYSPEIRASLPNPVLDVAP